MHKPCMWETKNNIICFDLDDISSVHVESLYGSTWEVHVYVKGQFCFSETYNTREDALVKQELWMRRKYHSVYANLSIYPYEREEKDGSGGATLSGMETRNTEYESDDSSS